ncbi:MAG: GatB/YqeY domain-containing protein [Castellaniella sp.]
MTVALSEQLSNAIREAMRARDSTRLGTLRFLQAAIRQKEVDERRAPDDDAVLAIIERQVKQRRESIAAFEGAGRTEAARKEREELAILQEFLPQAASEAEVAVAVQAAIDAAQADGLSGGAAMGRIMGQLKRTLAGRADMAAVSALVRERLSS